MWCIIIPFLTAIIGAILGWLLRHLTCKCDREEDKDKIISLLSENDKLKLELDNCLLDKKNLISSKAKFEKEFKLAAAAVLNKNKVVAKEPVLVFDAGEAKQLMGKKVLADNLTVVEGIGPKIAELFGEHDVKTWCQLSQTSVKKCQEILDAGGPRFRMHTPNTWPKQALLAFEGKWQELNDWQNELNGGK